MTVSPMSRLFALAVGLVVSGAAPAAAPSEFDAMDANGDGRISLHEHASAAARMFKLMDADGDGRLTSAELDVERLSTVDIDGDGVLTAREHADASRALFLIMDRNKDGTLSHAEFDAGHAALKKK